MVNIVKMTDVVWDEATKTLTFPESIGMYGSMYFDSASGELTAVYHGANDTYESHSPAVALPWESSTNEWKLQNSYRTELTKKEFYLQFTAAEYRALMDATATDDVMFQLFNTLEVADFVELTDPVTVNGMAYVVGAGHLTQERHDEIMLGILEV